MIPIELAFKLKEAGFPQKEGNMYTSEGVWIPENERQYIPTLSELISACGEDTDGNRNIDHPFASLAHMSDMESWEAECWFIDFKGIGSSPEEAVANLWLSLHKK